MRGYLRTSRPQYLATLETLATLWELGSPLAGWFPLPTSTYYNR